MHNSFNFLGLEFPAYFTLLMLGYMLAVYLVLHYAPREELNRTRVVDLAILMLITGVFGCRIAHVLFDGQFMNYYYWCVDPLQSTGEFLSGTDLKCTTDQQCVSANLGELCNTLQGSCHRGKDCLLPLKFWYGGLTFYGGLLLCIPVGIWFLRRFKMRVWRLADLAGFAIPLGLGFGRLGCWFSGCCFGDVCDVPWGVSFPNGSMAWSQHYDAHLVGGADPSLPVHPTQIYSIASNWFICGFMLWWYHKKRTFEGEVFWLFVLLYAVSRFIVELWRDDARGEVAGISTSQIIGALMVVVAIAMLRRLYQKSQTDPEQTKPPDEESSETLAQASQ
jgi:phosphatidylglycerol:prolipoprotein diacylglycerol transferase